MTGSDILRTRFYFGIPAVAQTFFSIGATFARVTLSSACIRDATRMLAYTHCSEYGLLALTTILNCFMASRLACCSNTFICLSARSGIPPPHKTPTKPAPTIVMMVQAINPAVVFLLIEDSS